MASYNELNALIDAYINRNGVQAITGQILNGVLKAMVEQLGRGYTIMGAAIPTTDPGTPDGPECYFASETGTYTDFNGLQIVPGELALLCYTPSDGWTKETIYEGFQAVQATIDGNVGTPSVGVSYANGVLSFDFRNMKGNTGDPAGFGTIGADITGGVGTPGVTVESSGPATAKNLQFHFTNLKGETGVTSVVATVDNTTGTPACTVSLVGQQLTLAFTGLKGAQGDTGSSVDYPFTIVNNLTTDDATQALSAAQGVVLEGEITQLEAKVDGINSEVEQSPTYTPCRYVLVNGVMSPLDSATTYAYCQPIDITGVTSIRVRGILNAQNAGGIFFSNYNVIPASSAQAAGRIVRAYYGTTSTSGEVNEEMTFDAATLNELRGQGAKYIYVGVYQSGQKEMVFITNTPGLEDRVQALEENIGAVPALEQEVNGTKETVELLDRRNGIPFELKGYYNQSGVFTPGDSYRATKPFSLEGVSKILAIYTAYAGSTTNVVYYNENMEFLSYGVWGQRLRKELTIADFPNGAKYAAFSTFAVYLPQAMVIVNGVYSQDERIRQLISWQDRIGVCYGDSITAQGNDGVSGYVGVLNREILFSALYGRGVGGQSYVWNNGGWYTEVGTNGAYLDRYQYDSEGNKTNLLIPADATEEQINNIESALGKTIEVHRGCFCSWDRIMTMIPASIKDNVDLIILMGGTNDFGSNHAPGTGIPEWSSANITDTDWVNDANFYNGGDYDLSTFSGGLMSTIMKMTVWCPNAVIVVVAPWGNYNTTTKAQTENGNGNIIQQFADREKEMAEYLGCPFINISAEAGVNPFNASTYFADDYHPNSLGARLIARVLIGGLRRIPARLV